MCISMSAYIHNRATTAAPSRKRIGQPVFKIWSLNSDDWIALHSCLIPMFRHPPRLHRAFLGSKSVTSDCYCTVVKCLIVKELGIALFYSCIQRQGHEHARATAQWRTARTMSCASPGSCSQPARLRWRFRHDTISEGSILLQIHVCITKLVARRDWMGSTLSRPIHIHATLLRRWKAVNLLRS